MEGMAAKWYAANTGKSREDFKKLAQRVAARVPRGASVLDVAPGPGYFPIELAKTRSCQVAGLDISQTFVKLASENVAAAGVQADFRQGSASFKNFGEPVAALQEMYRVLNRAARA